MDREKLRKFTELFKKYGIEASYATNPNFKYAFERSPEEFEKILLFCQKKKIDYSGNSCVWMRTYDELVEIVNFVTSDDVNIPFQKGGNLYTRTPEQVKKIFQLCRKYEIEYWWSNDTYYITNEVDKIFRHSPESIEEIIKYCEETTPKLNYRDQKIFEFQNVEEIKIGNDFCKKIGIDFSNFLGVDDDNAEELWISYHGIEYLFDTTGKKLIKCHNPRGDVIVPDFVEEISDEAFKDCNELHSVVIPGSVRRVGMGAFLNCKGLYEVKFNGELTEIEDSTFKECTMLQRIKWPNGLKKIGREAFRNSSIGDFVQTFGITDDYYFKIPDSVQIIGELAFCECENLTKFYAPEQLIEARFEAFKDCHNLTKIILSSKTEYFDPSFRQSSKKMTVWYGNWHMLAVDNNLRVGYENYVQRAENLYEFCKLGLKKVRDEGKLDTVYLPSYFKANNISEFESSYIRELVELISYCDKRNVYAKVFSRLNVDLFKDNMDYLIKKVGVDKQCLAEIIVNGNNYNLLNCSINAFFDNYRYLCDQKLVSESILKKLYFGDAVGDTPEKLFKNYYDKYHEFPELFNSLLIEHNDKNKLELRDRLTYVSTMHLLDENFTYIQLETAKDKLKYSLIENVINRDKIMFIDSDIYDVLEEKYPAMCGIMYSLKDKLMGMDEKWFGLLLKEIKKGGQDTTFDKFYNSLTVVKNWDKYDEKERMTLLKNEIVGRLLYADIFLTCKESTDKGYDAYLSNRGNNLFVNLLKFASKERDDLFFNSHKLIIGPQIIDKNGTPVCDEKGNIRTLDVDVYSQIGFILTMLKIDPYSFDALRMPPGGYDDTNQLEILFAIFAKEQGYLFSENEKNKFCSLFDKMSKEKIIEKFIYYQKPTKKNNKRTLNSDFEKILFEKIRERFNNTSTAEVQKTFSEFMSNIIGTARIPKDMEGKYLDYVRESAHNFLSTKSINDLYSFCSSLDLYLRSKSEYDIQTRDKFVEDSARVVFDRTASVSDDARIIYSLHNLNRLAHDVVEIDLKSVLDHRSRLDVAKANIEYKELSSIITAYNDLFHIGFTSDDILRIIDPRRKRFDRLNSKYTLFVDTVSRMSESDKNRISTDIAFFESVACDVLEKLYDEVDYVDADINIDFDSLSTIMAKLKIIKDKMYDGNGNVKLSEEDRNLIDNSIKAKSYFFEAKKLFAQELMGRMAREFSDNFVYMLDATSTEKINFYSKNGYIAEIQYDENGHDILVCLCKEFNEPFSIHLKDMPKDIGDKLKRCSHTATITHARLDRRGLTLRDNDFERDISSIEPAEKKGFVESDKLLNAIKSNYVNYDLPVALNTLRQIRDNVGRVCNVSTSKNSSDICESSSELEIMVNDRTNSSVDANTNTGGNKHQ